MTHDDRGRRGEEIRDDLNLVELERLSTPHTVRNRPLRQVQQSSQLRLGHVELRRETAYLGRDLMDEASLGWDCSRCAHAVTLFGSVEDY